MDLQRIIDQAGSGWSWKLLGLLAVIWLIGAYKTLLGPLLIGVLLAYLLNPLVRQLKIRTGLKHRAAVNIVYLLFLAAIILSAVLLTPIVIQQMRFLSAEIDTILDEISLRQASLSHLLGIELPVEEMVEELKNETAQFLRSDRLFRVIRAATANSVWLLVILVVSYSVLMDWSRMRAWLFSFIPAGRQADAEYLYAELKAVWQTYLRGQLLIMGLMGLLAGVGGSLLGLKGALSIGLLAAGLEIIPSLGPTAATTVAGLTAWRQGSALLPISNFWFTILVVSIFIGFHVVESLWLQPQIIGRRMQMHPALVFVAVVSTLSLLGALAGLMVVPVMASAAVLLQYARHGIVQPEALTDGSD